MSTVITEMISPGGSNLGSLQRRLDTVKAKDYEPSTLQVRSVLGYDEVTLRVKRPAFSVFATVPRTGRVYSTSLFPTDIRLLTTEDVYSRSINGSDLFQLDGSALDASKVTLEHPRVIRVRIGSGSVSAIEHVLTMSDGVRDVHGNPLQPLVWVGKGAIDPVPNTQGEDLNHAIEGDKIRVARLPVSRYDSVDKVIKSFERKRQINILDVVHQERGTSGPNTGFLYVLYHFADAFDIESISPGRGAVVSRIQPKIVINFTKPVAPSSQTNYFTKVGITNVTNHSSFIATTVSSFSNDGKTAQITVDSGVQADGLHIIRIINDGLVAKDGEVWGGPKAVYTSWYKNSAEAMLDLANDTTPQLGGILDTAGNQVRWSKGDDVSSATAVTLGTDGNYFDITGTTTITSINTLAVGTVVKLHFDGALTFTHHATNLILPGGANITTAAGDEAELVEYASADWRCTSYTKADGTPVVGGGATLTQEQVEDYVGGMLDGDETFITVAYDDSDGNIDFTVPVKDEDAMGSNSATHLATQQSIKAYVDGKTHVDATTVTAAGALMDSEVTDLDGIKSLTVPNSTTISTFGASLVDDAAAGNARTTLGLGDAATKTVGISDGNVLAANDAVADNDFLKIDGTEVEGRTAAEVRGDLNVEDGATADQSAAEIKTLLEDGIDSVHYVDGSIDGVHIANDAIDSQHYADGSIDNAHIADNAIDSEHYADGSIDNAHIADDAIDSEHYADGSIDTAHIGDDQVTYAKMQNVSADERILGRVSGADGVIEELTKAQVLTFANVADGAIANVVDDTSPQLGAPLDTNSKQVRWSKGDDVASTADMTLGSDGNYFDITGTATIQTIATLGVGTVVMLQFDAAAALRHSSSIVCPTAANITAAAGDHAILCEISEAVWRVVNYQRASGVGPGASPNSSTYIVANAADASLTHERYLVGGGGITLTDQGAGGKMIINFNRKALGEAESVDAAMIVEQTAGSNAMFISGATSSFSAVSGEVPRAGAMSKNDKEILDIYKSSLSGGFTQAYKYNPTIQLGTAAGNLVVSGGGSISDNVNFVGSNGTQVVQISMVPGSQGLEVSTGQLTLIRDSGTADTIQNVGNLNMISGGNIVMRDHAGDPLRGLVDGLDISSLRTQTTGQGASIIGIHDSGSHFSATNVEGALREVGMVLDAFSIISGGYVQTSGDFIDVSGSYTTHVDASNPHAITLDIASTQQAGVQIPIAPTETWSVTNDGSGYFDLLRAAGVMSGIFGISTHSRVLSLNLSGTTNNYSTLHHAGSSTVKFTDATVVDLTGAADTTTIIDSAGNFTGGTSEAALEQLGNTTYGTMAYRRNGSYAAGAVVRGYVDTSDNSTRLTVPDGYVLKATDASIYILAGGSAGTYTIHGGIVAYVTTGTSTSVQGYYTGVTVVGNTSDKIMGAARGTRGSPLFTIPSLGTTMSLSCWLGNDSSSPGTTTTDNTVITVNYVIEPA
jgi:hypothetical protein